MEAISWTAIGTSVVTLIVLVSSSARGEVGGWFSTIRRIQERPPAETAGSSEGDRMSLHAEVIRELKQEIRKEGKRSEERFQTLENRDEEKARRIDLLTKRLDDKETELKELRVVLSRRDQDMLVLQSEALMMRRSLTELLRWADIVQELVKHSGLDIPPRPNIDWT